MIKHMFRIKSARVVAAISLCGVALSAAAHSAKDAPAGLMPKVLAGVSLGMTETDFRKVRPAAESFVIFNEPEVKGDDPNPWYTEPLKGDPFFDLATFAFFDHRLCVVSLSALGQGEAFRLKRTKVLQGAVRKWGRGYERLWQAGSGRGCGFKSAPAKVPVLLWKLGSCRVLARFSDGDTPASQGGLSIVILDTRCLPPVFRRCAFRKLVPANQAQRNSVSKIFAAPVKPPLFE